MSIKNQKDSLDQYGLVCKVWFKADKETEAILGRKVNEEDPHYEGGDSLNRTFANYFVSDGHNGAFSDFSTFVSLNGLPRRHPDKRFWYGDDDRCSRDQYIPLIACLAKIKFAKGLEKLFRSHLNRGLLFMTNTRRNGTTKENHGKVYGYNHDGTPKIRDYSWKLPDFTGPSIWAVYVRGFRLWVLWPLLVIFDLELLINACIIRQNKKDKDVINHCILSKLSEEVMPTPTTWLLRKVNDYKDLGRRLTKFYDGPGLPYWLGKKWDVYLNKLD